MSTVDEKLKNRVESYLNGELIVKVGFEPLDISNGIDWNYQHSNNANTYQTYLHSLGILNDLVKMGNAEDDETYYLTAKNYIMDWFNSDHSEGKNHAWSEHPVSSRVKNIINFQSNAEKYKLDEKTFDSIIEKHCEFLNDEKNYKSNNHGLMMDEALIIASDYLKNNTLKQLYVDKALYRVKFALYRDFTRKGVHLENSPEYHRMVLNMFRKIEKGLKKLNRSFGKDAQAILRRASIYRSYIIKPNFEYPIIGDTGTIKDTRIQKKFLDFIDYDAGMCILQNKHPNEIEKSTWLSFKSGYHSKTHKHKDDLSITFYVEGNDLLIDSGKYGYSLKDPVRKFIVSPDAHSTISIEGKDYELKNPIDEQFKLKISRFMKKGEYKLVTGFNNLYDNSTVVRHTALTTNNHLFIVDRVRSDEEELIYQTFNINENAMIKKINELKYEIQLNDDTYILETVKKNNETVTSEIREGYISRAFSNYVNNYRVLFKQKSKDGTFITALYNKKDEDNIKEISLKAGKLNYSFKEVKQIIDL